MATEHARSGEIVDVMPAASGAADARSTAIVRDARLEVMRLLLPAGKHLPEHRTFGPITIQCLDGAVDVTVAGAARRLEAGRLMFLAGGVPHAVSAVRPSCLLVTMVIEAPPAAGGDAPRHGERTGD